VRRFTSAVVAVAVVVVLAACSFNPRVLTPNYSADLVAERMAEIVDALNSQDAATLKAMFTDYALAEYSAEIDEGVGYLLSLFPNGDVVWEDPDHEPSPAVLNNFGKRTELVGVLYEISAGREDYRLYFSYYTINENDPANVGIYGMGVAPRTENLDSGPEEALMSWAGSVADLEGENGPPGVYIPSYDYIELSDLTMEKVVEDVTAQDVSGLRVEVFSEYAQTEHAAALDDEIDALYSFVSSEDLTWQLRDEPLAVREKVEGDDEAILLLPIYEVTSGGKDYWLFFADFTVNTIDPTNLGLYAVGVAARTPSGDSPEEQALFAWADTFDVDASTPPGILISQ
jgi:hypothetical protein